MNRDPEPEYPSVDLRVPEEECDHEPLLSEYGAQIVAESDPNILRVQQAAFCPRCGQDIRYLNLAYLA